MPEKATYQRVEVDLKNATGPQLVDYLSHKNGWYRSTAQRLLLERQDKSAVPALISLFSNSKDARARLHALYALEGLNSLNEKLVKLALLDTEAGVRENAIILAERYPKTIKNLLPMIHDQSKRVALQASLSIGEFKGKKVLNALAEVVMKYGENDWFRSAVISSEAGSSVELLYALTQANSFLSNEESWKLNFIQDLSNIIGARYNKEQFSAYLNKLTQEELFSENFQLAALKGLKLGLKKNESTKDLADQLNIGSAEEVKEGLDLLKRNN
jgi:HEAT repeat protein